MSATDTRGPDPSAGLHNLISQHRRSWKLSTTLEDLYTNLGADQTTPGFEDFRTELRSHHEPNMTVYISRPRPGNADASFEGLSLRYRCLPHEDENDHRVVALHKCPSGFEIENSDDLCPTSLRGTETFGALCQAVHQTRIEMDYILRDEASMSADILFISGPFSDDKNNTRLAAYVLHRALQFAYDDGKLYTTVDPGTRWSIRPGFFPPLHPSGGQRSAITAGQASGNDEQTSEVSMEDLMSGMSGLEL